jgi:hypothetical protein
MKRRNTGKAELALAERADLAWRPRCAVFYFMVRWSFFDSSAAFTALPSLL